MSQAWVGSRNTENRYEGLTVTAPKLGTFSRRVAYAIVLLAEGTSDLDEDTSGFVTGATSDVNNHHNQGLFQILDLWSLLHGPFTIVSISQFRLDLSI